MVKKKRKKQGELMLIAATIATIGSFDPPPLLTSQHAISLGCDRGSTCRRPSSWAQLFYDRGHSRVESHIGNHDTLFRVMREQMKIKWAHVIVLIIYDGRIQTVDTDIEVLLAQLRNLHAASTK